MERSVKKSNGLSTTENETSTRATGFGSLVDYWKTLPEQISNTQIKTERHVLDQRHKFVGLTGGRVLYQKLVQHGIKLACGISGSGNIPLIDAFHPDHYGGSPPIKFITNSNESNCGHVSEGYAKASGKPAVTLVTSGPGLTNIITPLQDAYCDGVPMVALSGQVSTTAQPEAFQCVDAIALTKPCTKWNYELKSVAEIPMVIDYAMFIACSGRPGPVHVDCPKDIIGERFKEEHLQLSSLSLDGVQHTVGPQGNCDFSSLNKLLPLDNKQLENIVKLINKSQRPVLLVGQGAIQCKEELAILVKKTNIPVTTTLHAMGVFDERLPLALQMVGMHGHPTANYMVQQADLVIALGSRFDDKIVGTLDTYAPKAREAQNRGKGGFIHVEIRLIEKNRIVRVNEFVNADCKTFLQELNRMDLECHPRADWINLMNQYKQKYPIKIAKIPEGRLCAQRVILELNKQIEPYRERCVFTTGVGCHQMVAAQLITWATPQSIITSGSLGTMGVAIGFAIGAKLADTSKTVIAIDGDGSFNMTNTELKTIMNLQLPVKILIMNNGCEMMAGYWQNKLCDGRKIATDLENSNYNKLADAYGIFNMYCDNDAQLSQRISEFLRFEGPVLFNVLVEKTFCAPVVLPGSSLDDVTQHE